LTKEFAAKEKLEIVLSALVQGAAREQMAAWSVKEVPAWENALPITLISGVPDCWPHLRRLEIGWGYTLFTGGIGQP